MKYIVNITLIICGFLLNAQNAQNSFLPQNLGPNINTAKAEVAPVLTPDGNTLYFVRQDCVMNEYWQGVAQFIWKSELQPDGTWGAAEKMPFPLNTAYRNAVLGFSPDGNIMYINGRFTNKMKWHKRGITQLKKTADGTWGEPKKLYVRGLQRMNKGDLSNFSFSNDGKWLFISMSKRIGSKNNNIYVCKRYDDIFWRPRKLKKPIRGYKKDEAPFLSIDQNYLYFTSDRKHPDKKGKYDIFRATRTDETYRRWSEPVPISDTINSPEWDSYYITNAKGSWAYFCSKNNSTGRTDIFRVKLFEENPFVLVSGKILNKRDEKPLANNVIPRLMLDGNVVDTVNVNADGEFKILLPLKAKYELSATAPNFDTENKEIVDVSAVLEYSTKDSVILYLKPSNALVSGKLILENTKGSIPLSAEPILLLNGKELNNNLQNELGLGDFKVDFETGEYSIKLALKKSYDLQIKAKGFLSTPVKIDLSKTEEYKEIQRDLFVTDPPKLHLLITGKVYDRKTNKLFDPNKEFSIKVNDGDASLVKINRADASYEVKLDLGKYYTLNATAPGYYPQFESVDVTNEKQTVKVVKDLFIAPIEVGQSIKLNNIFFDFGKSTLQPASFPELDKLAKFLEDNPTINVEIAGHTDNKGSAEKNMQLSRWRARAVQLYLVEQKGIDIKRVKFNGYGMTKPVADNKTETGRALNRRVEFTILGL
ncbi:MAG: OmpA family protein [Cytophagales bacterium]